MVGSCTPRPGTSTAGRFSRKEVVINITFVCEILDMKRKRYCNTSGNEYLKCMVHVMPNMQVVGPSSHHGAINICQKYILKPLL